MQASSNDVLDLEFEHDDLGYITVRLYFKELLKALWEEGEGFSGKRPLGNSGWEYDLYKPLVKAGIVDGSFDEEGYIDEVDTAAADKIVLEAIEAL
jgi:hypothetical protein